MNYIRTFCGHEFDFSRLKENVIDIHDIAWALSMTCRYGGHSKKFYSVAEHCILVSQVCPNYKFEGLMHDAAEAYIGDIVTPLKKNLHQFLEVERELEQIIAERFGLRYPWPEEVKEFDFRILSNEISVLMSNKKNDIKSELIPNIEIKCLSSSDAYDLFLTRFNELKDGPVVKTNLGEIKL